LETNRDSPQINWKYDSCHRQGRFVCKKPAGKYVYKVSHQNLTWLQANKSCQQWGGTLATNSAKENTGNITGLIDNDSKYWIGMEYSSRRNKIRWVNSSPVGHLNFFPK